MKDESKSETELQKSRKLYKIVKENSDNKETKHTKIHAKTSKNVSKPRKVSPSRHIRAEESNKNDRIPWKSAH